MSFCCSSVLVLALLIGATTPLGAEPSTTYPLQVRDGVGEALVIPTRPEKIVSLTLTSDEILLDLVDVSRLTAISRFAEDPGVSNIVTRIGPVSLRLQLNVEVIIALDPDVVFAASWSNADSIRQLRNAGISVYQILSSRTVDEVKETIRQIALIVDAQPQALALIAEMERRLEYVADHVAGLGPDRRLRVLDYSPDGASSGRGSSWDDIVTLAGLTNAIGHIKVDQWGSVALSQEAVIRIDPDVVVLPGWVWGDPEGARRHHDRFTGDPAFRSLRAVREDRVMLADERHRTSTSHFIVSAVEDLAVFAYPELFP